MNAYDVAKLILKKSKKKIPCLIKSNFDFLVSKMPSDWSQARKAWHLLYGNNIPNCRICNQPAKFMSVNYWKWCSKKCMGSDPQILEKKKQTNKTKWGVEYPQVLDEFKQKQKQTVISRYGVDNYSKTDQFHKKLKNTSQKKYGVDNPAQSITSREKISKSARLRNYTKVVNKRKKTNLFKYGFETNKHIHIDLDNLNKLNDIDYLIDQHVNKKKSCQEIANELGCSPTPILTRLSQAGINVIRHNTSSFEKEISQYIESLSDTKVVKNTRSLISPYEIDLYMPDLKTAIECNGVYWHSELNGKDRYYHIDKTLKCNDQNIQLWHILDIEWLQQQDIVKSKIKGMLGLLKKIPARKCTIKTVSTKEKTDFLNRNHLQGTSGSAVNLGLYYEGVLVSLMTFGKSRYSKSVDWELMRFCNKLDNTVVGGASRLFKHFVKLQNPVSVVSYADHRWSNGNLYNQLGFDFSHRAAPNYFYFDNSNCSLLESRVKYQKHKLSKILNKFDPSLTEWENMKQNNYNRIWDCGNLVYFWKRH